jgi:putative aldouronate transport system substrate-binding protein
MTRKNVKRVTAIVMAVVVTASLLLSGCTESKDSKPETSAATKKEQTQTNQQSASTKESLKPVNLVWYLAGTEQPDEASVEEAANKILKGKINASLDMIVTPFGSYDQKMQVKMASGEEFDLCFTTESWLVKYVQAVTKGAFLPLNDLLTKYAPEFKASIPAKYWEQPKIKGELYAVPNYQMAIKSSALCVRKNIFKPADMDAFFGKVKSDYPDLIPFVIPNYVLSTFNFITDIQYDPVLSGSASETLFGIVELGDEKCTLKNVFTDDTLKDKFYNYISKMHDWYKKGYINKDAASVKNVDEMVKSGIAASYISAYKPGMEADHLNKYKMDTVAIKLMEPKAGPVKGAMTAISKTSKNPERAMMLLEETNTNKELYNLLVFGIEDKHYKKITEDGTQKVEMIENGGYWSSIPWQLGNQFNAYITKGQPANVWEETQKLNEESLPSPLLGFTAGADSVKAQVANANSIADEYIPGLVTGTLDPNKYFNEYLQKINDVDPDFSVMKEMQKQINEWKKGE